MTQHKRSWSFQDTSLERSFLWSLAITALPVASGFFVSWITARWAGARVVGTVSWVMAFATALLILAKMGLDLAASRLASDIGVRQPGQLARLFRTAFNLRLAFTLLVTIPSFVFAKQLAGFFNDAALVTPIRIGAIVVLCASLYELQENFLVGLNRLSTVYRVRSVHLLSRVILTTGLVFAGYQATEILGGYCAAWLIGICVYGILLWRFLPAAESEAKETQLVRRLLLLSLPLAVSSASVTIYSQMDRLMLGYFSGMEEVGQYAVARNITEITLFPVFALVMMLRPALASRFSSDAVAECARIIRRSLRFSLISGVLFASIFSIMGPPLITIVYSDSFVYAGQLMVFFVGVIALRSLGAIILPALIAAERARVYAVWTTCSAIVNFVLNLILIPRFDARGAIVATIVSYGLLLGGGLWEVFRTYNVRLTARAISLSARTILAGTLAAAIVWLILSHIAPGPGVFLWAVFLTIIYVLLVALFRVATLSEFGALVTNLRKSNG